MNVKFQWNNILLLKYYRKFDTVTSIETLCATGERGVPQGST